MIVSCMVIFEKFLRSYNLVILNEKSFKNVGFGKFELESKLWLFILKDFDFLDIFIESKWGVILIYIYVLKLMESKINEDINLKKKKCK